MTGRRAWPARLFLGVCLSLIACTPRLGPLPGSPAPLRVLAAELPVGHQKVVFRWELEDREMRTRGDGVARVAPPDSVRLDFFLGGGFGGGEAVLIGDSLRAPGSELLHRMIPPAALLWASLGRFRVPPLPDTTARVDGTMVRADIGRPVAWRVTIAYDSLVRLERVLSGRVVQWVERSNGIVRFRDEGDRRVLSLTIVRTEHGAEFDASIWNLP